MAYKKWLRHMHQPCLPLGDNGTLITECATHRELSRKAAHEGTVLLKNNNSLLPLKKGTKLAVFGNAQIDYVKGGGGSGDTHVSHVTDIYEGLKQKSGKVEIFDELSLFYKEHFDREYKIALEEQEIFWSSRPTIPQPEIPQELLQKAKDFTDTAIITINRNSGEGFDHKNDGTDDYFYLSSAEKKMVETVCKNFNHIIVLLNVGAMPDVSWFADNDKIEAAVMIWQGGMLGGLAAADILVGDNYPSGKLVDTCAWEFSDYPSSEGFHESNDYVKYTEDIFVGYRYFETVPNMKERVVYPFGYGLSYTSFELSDIYAHDNGKIIFVSLDVTNTGNAPSKEIIQVYYSAPRGMLTKPAKELCAFAKTRELKPGEKQTLTLSFNISDMASYDDTGVIQKSGYVLEKGEYEIYVGTSIRDTHKTEYSYKLNENIIIEQLTEFCVPKKLGKRMKEDGSYIEVRDTKTKRSSFECDYVEAEKPEKEHMLIDVANGEITIEEFIAQLSDDELINITGGQPNTGVAVTLGIGNIEKYGVPSIMTTDGPAGVRIPYGITTTAFPVATMLACTWNLDLIEEIGKAGALEVKENNMGIWLTPALNIHRSPLCGRNFEYYSEDPFVSGKMAAAMVRGIQSQNIAAEAKHFACNNKETNRLNSDSILSERALREIYLKGFEICVKESGPKAIMTSFNIINGVRACENAELITGILRGEWGYKGMITSDWFLRDTQILEIKAGNDMHMDYGVPHELKQALQDGTLKRNELCACVKRILETILWME